MFSTPPKTTSPRIARRKGSQANAVEAFATRVREAASRVWQEAVRLEALGLDASGAWWRYGAILERGYILTGLLGAAASRRDLRARGLTAPVPDQPSVHPVAPGGHAEFSEALTLQGVVHAPFLSALDVFRKEIPGLQSVFDDLARAAKRSVGESVEIERRTALPDLRERVQKAVAGRHAPGASPLVREATPEQLAAAVDAAMGVASSKSRTETIARTLTMQAFNAGSYQQMTKAGVYAAYRLHEIHDTRTRGNPNPNGLYPMPPYGPHWQMDGFVAAADDPIWGRIWPPNGYNCRATVVGLTHQDMRRMGFWIEDESNPRGGMLDRVKLADAFKRQRAFVESGKYPDPGFDRNVGAMLV